MIDEQLGGESVALLARDEQGGGTVVAGLKDPQIQYERSKVSHQKTNRCDLRVSFYLVRRDVQLSQQHLHDLHCGGWPAWHEQALMHQMA